MSSYWDRLRPEMEAVGLDASALAAKLDISYQAVAKMQRGGSFGLINNIKAAQIFGLNPDWLATGVGQKYGATSKAGATELDPAPRIRRLKGVPVVGEVKGGGDGYLEELQYPVGQGEGFVDYPTADAAAYALRVRGDSMHPRYRAGEFIVVSPSVEAQLGDDVVVALKDGRKLLKQMNWLRDGEVQLLSINDGYAPMTIQLSDVLFIQLVDGRVRRSALERGRT